MNGKILGGIGVIVATLFVMSLATTNVHAASKRYCFTAIVSDPLAGDVEQSLCCDRKKDASNNSLLQPKQFNLAKRCRLSYSPFFRSSPLRSLSFFCDIFQHYMTACCNA